MRAIPGSSNDRVHHRYKSSSTTIIGKGDNPRWRLTLADTCFPCWNGKDWHSLRRAICKTRPVIKKRIPQGLVPHILDNVAGQVFSANFLIGRKKSDPKKIPHWKIIKKSPHPLKTPDNVETSVAEACKSSPDRDGFSVLSRETYWKVESDEQISEELEGIGDQKKEPWSKNQQINPKKWKKIINFYKQVKHVIVYSRERK